MEINKNTLNSVQINFYQILYSTPLLKLILITNLFAKVNRK